MIKFKKEKRRFIENRLFLLLIIQKLLDFLLFNLFAMLADWAGEVMFSTVRKGRNPIECKLSAGFNNVLRCDVMAVGTLDIALGLS